MIDLGKRRRILSSAPRGGGFVRSRYVLNYQVPANPISISNASSSKCGNASRYLRRIAETVGADSRCVALMTAVPMKHLVALREEAAGLWVEGFLTVGVTNAVRAGEPTAHNRADGPGTINIVLVTNARLATSAMVCAVQVATEAKTAALFKARVPSCTGRAGATGTGTDVTVVVSGEGPYLRYSGTHTELGAMIGRLVGRGVRDGLLKAVRKSLLVTYLASPRLRS